MPCQCLLVKQRRRCRLFFPDCLSSPEKTLSFLARLAGEASRTVVTAVVAVVWAFEPCENKAAGSKIGMLTPLSRNGFARGGDGSVRGHHLSANGSNGVSDTLGTYEG